MKIRYTPRARGDIESIWYYLNERSPSSAANVVKAIYAGVQFIADHPEASQRAEHPDIRVRVVRRYRYKIFYRIIDETIEILHIRHSSRRPWSGGNF
jgi:plasmid stabilization system protein ParE